MQRIPCGWGKHAESISLPQYYNHMISLQRQHYHAVLYSHQQFADNIMEWKLNLLIKLYDCMYLYTYSWHTLAWQNTAPYTYIHVVYGGSLINVDMPTQARRVRMHAHTHTHTHTRARACTRTRTHTHTPHYMHPHKHHTICTHTNLLEMDE